MARKKRKETGKVNYENIVWVIDNLTTEQLKSHDKKPFNEVEILEGLITMADDGFRITCKYDTFSKSYMATATCLGLSFDNSGLALAARGHDISDCLSIVLYKYLIIAEKDLRGFTDKVPTGVRG